MAGDKVRLPIAILIILIIMSLSLTGVTFYIFQKERAKNLSLQEELEDVKAKRRVIEMKLLNSEKLVSDLESKLEGTQNQIDNLAADLEQEKTAKEEAQAKVEQLRIDLEQREGLRSDLEKKFVQTENELQNLQARVKELESKKTELESKKTELETKIKDLEARLQPQGVELGKIVVSPESPKETLEKTSSLPQESTLEGKVLVINKDYDFAVINLGSKDGIGLGTIFSVYHNNKYIGDVKVEKIYDSMSAAGFVSDNLKDKINEGDKVVSKGK